MQVGGLITVGHAETSMSLKQAPLNEAHPSRKSDRGRPTDLCAAHCVRALPRRPIFDHHRSKKRHSLAIVDAIRMAQIETRLYDSLFTRRRLEIRSDEIVSLDSTAAKVERVVNPGEQRLKVSRSAATTACSPQHETGEPTRRGKVGWPLALSHRRGRPLLRIVSSFGPRWPTFSASKTCEAELCDTHRIS